MQSHVTFKLNSHAAVGRRTPRPRAASDDSGLMSQRLLLGLLFAAVDAKRCEGSSVSICVHSSGASRCRPRFEQLPPPLVHDKDASQLIVRRTLLLRGGATVGPFKLGPLVLDVKMGPLYCVYLNAVAGSLYALSLLGLDPALPDPTEKYWQTPQTPTTKCILQYFALTLLWINGFMIYAICCLNAPAPGLLKFQTFGWASVLALIFVQVRNYGFTAQQDTLGIMLTLLGLSAYLGYAP